MNTCQNPWPRFHSLLPAAGPVMLAAAAALVLLVGCKSPAPTPLTEKELTPNATLRLREGDVLLVSFPGATNLNSVRQIRRDGKLDLPLIGEWNALGKTPSELEKELVERYGPQLVLKEVTVSVQSAVYPVFVTGAVVRPGKLTADRPLSALEAVMEAGGFNTTSANMKAVVVVRNENGQLRHYILNLKEVLEGKSKQLFYLNPGDILYVPEKSF